jgi:multidrug efflux pump subunit AcrB
MKSFVRFTLKQTVFINLVFVLCMVVGVFATFDLPVERYPNVHMGKVLVSAYLPGAAPEEVEALVTRKIEDALDGLENVEYISSRSYRQRSSVMIKFLDDTDYAKGFDDLRFKVLSIQNDLPRGMDPPVFTEIDVSEWLPVVTVNLTGERSNRALTVIAEEMKLGLKRIPGVQKVDIEGEHVREFHILLDPDKLSRHNLSFEQAAAGLTRANVSIPAGDFATPEGEYVIVVDERFRTRAQVAAVILKRDGDGSFVTMADVMNDARLAYRDPFVITSVNGRDSVALKVVKSENGNAMHIAAAVEEVVASMRTQLAQEGVEPVLTQDQRIYIQESITTLGANMLVGIFLVMLIIWLFMGFRNAMLTTVGIPFSFLVTMIIMWLTGNSLNEITLFSFVLVSGIIVDDAIVVVENIYRHYQEGKPVREAIIDGTSEVFLPVVAATSTTVAAFLPMLIMSGSTGEFFALVPKAVTFAILASLIECLLILTTHFHDWPGLKRVSPQGERQRERGFILVLKSVADRVLLVAIRRRWLAMGAVSAAFFLAMAILLVSITGRAPLIRIKFFPDNYMVYYVELQGPVATPIEQTRDLLKEVSAHIVSKGPGTAKSATAYAGFVVTEDYEQVFGTNLGNVVVEMPSKEDQQIRDPEEYLDAMRQELEGFAAQGWTMRIRAEKDGPPAGKDVTIRILGTNHEAVQGLAEEMHSFLRFDPSVAPHLINLDDDQGVPNRIVRFHPDVRRIAEYDLTPEVVAGLAASVLDGRFIGKYRVADEEVDLRLKIDPALLRDPLEALNTPLLEHELGPLRLADLAQASIFMEAGQLNRFQGQRAVTLTANIMPGAPETTPGIVQKSSRFFDSIRDQFPGAALDFSGEFESTRKSFGSLAAAFVVAVLAIYLILATQFRSYLQPVIILSSVVFALTGVVFGTFLTRSVFTVNSFIATVGVTGVVVNNSLVLLDFINKSYASGLSRLEAMREGVRIRLRPMLLTTLTTTLGLLPMAVGFPSYSLVWGTMATTFVTGLCTASALSIFLVPVQWDILTGATERIKGRRKAVVNLD